MYLSHLQYTGFQYNNVLYISKWMHLCVMTGKKHELFHISVINVTFFITDMHAIVYNVTHTFRTITDFRKATFEAVHGKYDDFIIPPLKKWGVI